MKLFIVVNVDWFFLSHRLPVALAAQKAGWDVTVLTADTGKLCEVAKAGLKAVNLPMSRSGMNILQELKAFWFLIKLYQKEKPDVVHHVGIKTILWGTLAAKFTKVHGVVNAISGLGGLFAEDNHSLLSRIIPEVLRFSHRQRNLLVIFQNKEDKALYINSHIIQDSQARMIRGSGVDLKKFCYTQEPSDGKIIVMLTCRMIREKGVFELVEAAEILRKDYSGKIEFWIVGGLDDHPRAITMDEIESVCDGKYIKWLGRREDVRELLQNSHIYAYPSYYKEGIPKSLIEAAAIGRPIVTTQNIGCKEVVENGVNGYLVSVKDAVAFAERIKTLIDDKNLRIKYGKASRDIAEKNFSLDDVIEKHLAIYQDLKDRV